MISGSELQITGGVVRGVVMGLTPGTVYEVTVAAVNGAGLGMASQTVIGTTLSGELE